MKEQKKQKKIRNILKKKINFKPNQNGLKILLKKSIMKI